MSDWRLLVDLDGADAATNMSIDDALLETCRDHPPTLRLYAWARPSLSLGYRQLAVPWKRRCAEAGLDLVRRTSGGGSVLHDGDLTYAVTCARGAAALGDDLDSSYAWIREALLAAFERVGVAATGARPVAGAERADVCFAGSTGYEVEVGGAKIVGSAQRRTPFGFLQHGSIRLTDDTPAYRAVMGELAPPPPPALDCDRASLARAIAEAFSERVSLSLAPDVLTPAECAARDRRNAARRADPLAAPGFS